MSEVQNQGVAYWFFQESILNSCHPPPPAYSTPPVPGTPSDPPSLHHPVHTLTHTTFFPLFEWLETVLGIPCLGSASVATCSSLCVACVFTWLSYRDTRHWIHLNPAWPHRSLINCICKDPLTNSMVFEVLSGTVGCVCRGLWGRTLRFGAPPQLGGHVPGELGGNPSTLSCGRA